MENIVNVVSEIMRRAVIVKNDLNFLPVRPLLQGFDYGRPKFSLDSSGAIFFLQLHCTLLAPRDAPRPENKRFDSHKKIP